MVPSTATELDGLPVHGYDADMTNEMQEITVYTDGGCSGNPGPGGWAFVVRRGTEMYTEHGGEVYTTNNKMELTAVINALSHIKETYGDHHRIAVYTDSQYVKNGITVWIHSWKRNGWKTANKSPVKNQELWMRLESLAESLLLRWNWVKGHAGVPMNELCDTLVRQAMDSVKDTVLQI